MESPYQVQIQAFEGPLDLLLQLIEKDKLSITEVSLASVTDQFLSYIDKREHVPLVELSSFLGIAAKLILLKSRSLLPTLEFTDDEDQSIEDLQMQLELYALFKESAKTLQGILESQKSFVVRDQYIGLEKVYFPPVGIGAQDLYSAFRGILGELEEAVVLPEQTLEKIISLEKRIQHIQHLLTERGKIAFSKMLQDGAHREEKIVSFLALLELIKLKFIFVEQSSHFEEMNIQKI